ncbi:glycosyltransferase [Granulicella sp. dw_53]|uniref:glycosyltransferase n=1 Tax=Granulicella sp. dw_53 TaxID=2719792 RepID=UPI001BD4D09D|nr:glycosyltransferase [Granulicella sp. dw_53]
MKRVLFIMSDLAGGGAERSLLELLNRLDRRRIEPSLFLLRRTGIHLDRVPADVRLSWGSENGARIRYQLPSILARAITEGSRADTIVGAMETFPSYVAWIAASILGIPLVGWIRTDLDIYLQSLPSWHSMVSKLMYPQFAAVVVPSSGSSLAADRITTIRCSKKHLIHNPVNLEEVREMATACVSPEMNELLTKPFILGVGRLQNDQKGFDLLVQAHAEVRSRGVDHRLVILGDGRDRLRLQQLAHSLNVEDSVFLPGYQHNPFPFFKAAKALAAPARLDGFGRVYLEAMALGLPVIGSPASGPTEILEQGRYGIIVPFGNIEALGHAMSSLLTDVDIHAHYSRLSFERAAQYQPEKIARQWDEVLCNVQIRG